ncbi:MAG: hypothetical protein AABW67_05975 [Nanoarchaeota archaeon]
MQNLSQKKQKLNYSKDVLDIVQFGSSLNQENPNDIDIAVIFKPIPIKEQLNQSQEIKKQIQELSKTPIHITSFDLYNFFDKGNFAKDSILIYGKSLISGDYFSNNFGVAPKVQIIYSLNDLKKKDKVKFNYLLNGKSGKYGLLREFNGKLIAPGIIEIPPEHETIFTEAIKKITSRFEINKTLIFK